MAETRTPLSRERVLDAAMRLADEGGIESVTMRKLARDALVRHRWASSLWMSGQSGGPARLRHGDWMLRTLRQAGLSKDLVYHAFHILEAYVLGFTTLQLSFPYEGEELAGMATRFLEQFPVDEYPDFVEHVREHLEPHDDEEGGFELGLDLILDSLERARGEAVP